MQQPDNDIIENENDINLKKIIGNFLRYWYVYVIALVFTLSAAYFYNWYVNPTYRVYAKILIKGDKGNAGTQELLKDLDVYSDSKNIDNEIEIIRSRKIIGQTIKKLELDVLYYLKGDVKKSQIYTQSPFKIVYDSLQFLAYHIPLNIAFQNSTTFTISYEDPETESNIEQTYTVGEPVHLPFATFKLLKRKHFNDNLFNNPEYDKKNYIVKFVPFNRNVDFYRARLQITQQGKSSSILELAVEDQIPQRGIDFLNTLINVYLENDKNEKNRTANSTALFIDKQLENISKELEAIELKRQTYKSAKGITDVSAESEMVLSNLKQTDDELSALELKLNYVRFLSDYVATHKQLDRLAPSSIDIEDPLLVKLIRDISELEQEKLTYENQSASHPKLEEINQRITYLKNALQENIETIKNGLQQAIDNKKKELAQVEKQLKTIPKTERELISIERKYRIKEQLYLYLLEKQAENSIALAASISDNRIIDEARSTPYPIRPVPSKSYTLAVILGLLLPTIGIFLKEQLRDTVYDVKEIEKCTANIPLLGVVGMSKYTDPMVVLHKPKSLIVESFRTVRTNLQYFIGDKAHRVILVTSSVSGEGKTFTSINLSAIIAQSGQKTILLGMDMRKPKMIAELGLHNEKGVSTYLSQNNITLEEVIQHTELEHFDVIPSGPIPPNPSELMMKDKMNELIERLKEKYDTIVIDPPPIGLVTDGLILNKYADLMIYVVRQGVTKKEHLKHLKNIKKQNNISRLAILFNAVKIQTSGYSYGYAYGYGYGYGYGHGYYEEDQEPKWYRRIFKKKPAKSNKTT